MKRILTFIVLTALMLSGLTAFAGCSNKNNLTGFDIELAKAVGGELGLEVKFLEIDWAQKDNELNVKNIDLIWNGFTITEERSKTTTFSLPYLKNKQAVVIRKADASKYQDTASLKTAKLVAESGSAGENVIKENNDLKTAVYNSVSVMNNIFIELTSGTSDAGVMDSIMADYYLKINSNYASTLMVIDSLYLQEEEYGIGMRKNSLALCDKINTALVNLYSSGKTKEIAQKYGLENNLIAPEYTTAFDTIEDKSDWTYISQKKTLIIGYTLFAPIAYFES